MATITINVIKPARMNEAAFRREILAALKSADKGIEKDFRDTTATWKHNVSFVHGYALTQNQGKAYTLTDDEIYRYVNDGTKPHPIYPKRAKALSFRWGGKGSYRPKTAPGRFGSRPGGPSGPQVAFKKVQHPGTKARKFDNLIGKRWLTLLPRALQDALSKGARASGHGIP